MEQDMRNLDAMERDELLSFAVGMEMLAQYAKIKAAAIEARLAGNINVAMAREQECDSIYARLPRNLRW